MPSIPAGTLPSWLTSIPFAAGALLYAVVQTAADNTSTWLNLIVIHPVIVLGVILPLISLLGFLFRRSKSHARDIVALANASAMVGDLTIPTWLLSAVGISSCIACYFLTIGVIDHPLGDVRWLSFFSVLTANAAGATGGLMLYRGLAQAHRATQFGTTILLTVAVVRLFDIDAPDAITQPTAVMLGFCLLACLFSLGTPSKRAEQAHLATT